MGMHKGMIGKIGPGSAELTLGDYIARKQRNDALDNAKTKLKFEDWYDLQVKKTGFSDPWQNSYDSAKEAWDAAQENV